MNTLLNGVQSLPLFLRDLLAAPPRRGEGLHTWIYSVARQLHAHGTESDIVHYLAILLNDRGVRPGEIEEAVRNSKASAWQPSFGARTAPLIQAPAKWPAIDDHRRAALLKCGCGLMGLIEASPVNMMNSGPSPEEIIDHLFPENPFLCCGSSATAFDTKPRELWRGRLADMQFIVPSPMSRLRGTTKNGNASTRCLDNTGPRRFLVLEFDTGTTDEHATILLQFAQSRPLAMVVHSGGKSLHGWFPCLDRTEEEVRGFFAYAVSLGADPATFSRCQMVRMPGGLRDNGQRQQVLFFNPGKLQ